MQAVILTLTELLRCLKSCFTWLNEHLMEAVPFGRAVTSQWQFSEGTEAVQSCNSQSQWTNIIHWHEKLKEQTRMQKAQDHQGLHLLWWKWVSPTKVLQEKMKKLQALPRDVEEKRKNQLCEISYLFLFQIRKLEISHTSN